MPELPEVEIIRRGLAPAMEGNSFRSVILNRADLRFPFEKDMAARLKGERVARLARRAKYIVAETEGGLALAMHLGMTGRFTVFWPGNGNGNGEGHAPGAFYYDYDADPRHDHVIFNMSGGEVIRYNDVRRFGYMLLLRREELAEHAMFRDLGVEPLSDALSPVYLADRARGKIQPLKNFLLDQRVIAGLGNIYVCEALFRAGLAPDLETGALGRGARGLAAGKRLCEAIKSVLDDALRAGGSSLKDYRHADGGSGGFQEEFDVYGRAGQPCSRNCGSTIERKVQQGRSTFFCPGCQGRF